MSYLRKAGILLISILGANISVGKAGKAEDLCRTTGISNYAVQLSLSEYPRAVCGGSLIKPHWVLTAASCLLKGRVTDMKVFAEYRFADIYEEIKRKKMEEEARNIEDKEENKRRHDKNTDKERNERSIKGKEREEAAYLADLDESDDDEDDFEVETSTIEIFDAGGDYYYYYEEIDVMDDEEEDDEDEPKNRKKMKRKRKKNKPMKAIQIETNATIEKQIDMNKKLVVASNVEDTFIHPMYNIPFVSNNDIALLRLEKRILVPRSQYANLPMEPVEDFDYKCAKVVMASWRSDTRSLHCEELQVKDRKDCGWPSSNLVFKNIFCAEVTEQTSRHPGESDTGGPVLCNNAQYGIVPYNFHCNKPGEPTHNCLYTRVDRMLEFIDESMQEYRLTSDSVRITISHSLIYAIYLFICLVGIQSIF